MPKVVSFAKSIMIAVEVDFRITAPPGAAAKSDLEGYVYRSNSGQVFPQDSQGRY